MNLGLGQLDGRRDAADQASAADWREYGFHLRQVFENLQPDGALAGDNFFVVIRRHDDVAVLGGQFFGLQLAFSAAGADEHDLGAEGCRGFALDGGSVVGHHDDRFHAQRTGGVGNALRVIAARVGDDAALALSFGERSDFVVRAAEFESADGLLIFRLEEEPGFARLDGRWRLSPHSQGKFNQAGADSYALESGPGFVDI